jgi:hypothetical protein
MKRPKIDGEIVVIVLCLVLCLVIVLSGCTTVRPLVEVSHTSHLTQHFGNNRTNYGWNVVGLGARIRPTTGVTIDVIEGYSFEPVDGRHEVFQARLLWEIGGP